MVSNAALQAIFERVKMPSLQVADNYTYSRLY